MTLELVERLPSDDLTDGVERWLARDGGDERIAILADDDDDVWQAVEDHFEPWIGVAHPALAVHLASGRARDRRVLLVHEDDRGPTLATAAGWIASPLDRERWAAAQVASLCDGVAAMAARQRGFVHRRVGDSGTFVDARGTARLRAFLAPRLFATDESPYRSPEQVALDLLTPASDVFQLGLTLYVALDGALPTLATPPPPRTSSPQLAQVIQIALAPEPTARFPEPAAFAAVLRLCVPPVAAPVYDEVASALRSRRD